MTKVAERETVETVADNFCYAATDNIAARRKQSSTREQLNSEPASIGEQVCLCNLFVFIRLANANLFGYARRLP